MYKKIEKLLKKKKLTPYRVAKETGLSKQLFTAWKQGKYEPSLKTLKVLSDYFDVEIKYFL